ncbi:MAG: hypothetical protein SW019_24790 [Actinomycetota bacterium]|nr:hypothetical protein [Actinomycetota bacterium]
MANTSRNRQAAATGSKDLWCGSLLALAGSVAIMLVATPGAVSPAVYWAVSSVALITALAVLVAGECAWEDMVANARAAGVVAR